MMLSTELILWALAIAFGIIAWSSRNPRDDLNRGLHVAMTTTTWTLVLVAFIATIWTHVRWVL